MKGEVSPVVRVVAVVLATVTGLGVFAVSSILSHSTQTVVQLIFVVCGVLPLIIYYKTSDSGWVIPVLGAMSIAINATIFAMALLVWNGDNGPVAMSLFVAAIFYWVAALWVEQI